MENVANTFAAALRHFWHTWDIRDEEEFWSFIALIAALIIVL